MHGFVHCVVLSWSKIPYSALTDRNGPAALADFGLSKSEAGKGDRRGMSGTVGYLDPSWAEDATYTAASDIYALGIVMLEVMARVG